MATPTQLDKLFLKGLSIPAQKSYGRQITAELVGSRINPTTYVLHQVAPGKLDYNIVQVNVGGKVTGAVRVTLKGVVYVAGPMRGIPLYNFPEFDKATEKLIAHGFFVFNPADLDRAVGVTEYTKELPPYFLRDAMDRDMSVICKSTHIYLLAGWENSSGVRPEGVLGDTLGDLTFLNTDLQVVPGQAVGAVIGGRLVARYQKWMAEQAANN